MRNDNDMNKNRFNIPEDDGHIGRRISGRNNSHPWDNNDITRDQGNNKHQPQQNNPNVYQNGENQLGQGQQNDGYSQGSYGQNDYDNYGNNDNYGNDYGQNNDYDDNDYNNGYNDQSNDQYDDSQYGDDNDLNQYDQNNNQDYGQNNSYGNNSDPYNDQSDYGQYGNMQNPYGAGQDESNSQSQQDSGQSSNRNRGQGSNNGSPHLGRRPGRKRPNGSSGSGYGGQGSIGPGQQTGHDAPYGQNQNSPNGQDSQNDPNKKDQNGQDDFEKNKDNNDPNSSDNDKDKDKSSDDNDDSSKDKDDDPTGSDKDKDGKDGSEDSTDSDEDKDKKDGDDKDKSSEDDQSSDKKGKDGDKDGKAKKGLGKLADKLKPKGPKKKFADFLKKVGLRKNLLGRNKKDQDLPHKIMQWLYRIWRILKLLTKALRMYTIYKTVAAIKTVMSWIVNGLYTIGSFVASIAASSFSFIAGTFLGFWGAIIAMIGVVITALVLILSAIWANNQQSQQNAITAAISALCDNTDQKSSSDSDDDDDGGAGGNPGKTKQKKFNIKVEHPNQKNIDKAAREIAKAIGKKLGIPAKLIYGQEYAEEPLTGPNVQPVVSQDRNLSGITWYQGCGYPRGTPHGEKDGFYMHFKNWNEYASEFATVLYADFKATGNHKMPKTVDDYFKRVCEKGYMTNSNGYPERMHQGVAQYSHPQHGGAVTAAGSEGGSSVKSKLDELRDDFCKKITGGDSGKGLGNIVKEAKKWLHAFSYSQKHRTLITNWKHPNRHSDMIDCSGFVWFVLKRCGGKVPAGGWATPFMESDARGPQKYLKRISKSQIRPGDIIIVNKAGTDGSGNNGHTAIFLTRWKGASKTKIIEEGGETVPDSQDHVNIHTVAYAFYGMLSGRVTFARAKGIKGGIGDGGGSGKNSFGVHLSKSEAVARAWIVAHESGGRWDAQNPGNSSVYGRYQLKKSYLKGDYSHKNQTRTAQKYVEGRYGSWKKAKKFWEAHNWY